MTGCKKLAGSEYVRRHNNALKVLAVQWAIDNGMLPSGTKWYRERDGRKEKLLRTMERSYAGIENIV